jgi:hypothetical protein
MSSSVAVTPFVVSVIVLLVKVAESAASVCPVGHEKPAGDTEPVSRTTLPVIRPFRSATCSTDVPTGIVMVVLFEADGSWPPPFTQPKVALTTVPRRYTTLGLPRPTSVQVNNRSGSPTDALALDVALSPVASELPAKLTEAVLKCGKLA